MRETHDCIAVAIRTLRGRLWKTFAQNCKKIISFSCPKNVRYTGSTPFSVRTHHKFQKIWSSLLQKVRTSTIHIWRTPLSVKCPYRTIWRVEFGKKNFFLEKRNVIVRKS